MLHRIALCTIMSRVSRVTTILSTGERTHLCAKRDHGRIRKYNTGDA